MKLISIDMDGTLLSKDLTISPQNIDAIKKAQAEGHIVMICSGRTKYSILKILNEYSIRCPIGASNGSIAFVDDQVIEANYLPKQTVSELTRFLEAGSFPYKLYTNKGVYVPNTWKERVMKAYKEGSYPDRKMTIEDLERVTVQELKATYYHLFDDVTTILADNSTHMEKIFLLTLEQDKRKQLVQDIQQITDITVTSSAPSNLEITTEHGNKGTALQAIANHFHIPMDQTIAIGDNFNDVPMMKAAGFSIAMGNAEEEVKEICDTVTLTNNESGVAHAVHKYVLHTEKAVQ
ncbi:Cof-type HAD-IIB family hydrolase [Ectobacillus polymachus]|uniref:Cof-type HAD-IIB family hydrolase n=1 Tax=Ectobacillus polymachus TaxID=1508806 RepID=UPI003A89D87D